MTEKLSLLFALMLSTLMASAHDIEVQNAQGKTIYYNYINNGTELAVSYRGSSYSSYSNEYQGNVVIPEEVTYMNRTRKVTSIGESAFYGCSSLTSVTIGNSVTSIGGAAFANCSDLTSVTIPNSVTSIGNGAFSSCSGLTSITIPNSVTSIGKNAFYKCSGLTSVTIPNSVTSIGEGAFSYCTGLTSITIPNSVTSIGGAAFEFCSGLTSVTIPNSVTSIESRAFDGCTGLTSVTIPNSVTSIGYQAFSGCSGLTSVTIGSGVTSIGGCAFEGCSGLTSLTIPNSVTSIGNYAFYNCSKLTSVTIPNSVTSIGYWAFSSCSELADVYCYAENVPSTQSDAFKDSYVNYATLYVPEASVAVYKAAEPWSGFGKIVAIEGEPGIEKCAMPVISIVDGSLNFSCETEGVKYICRPEFLTDGNNVKQPSRLIISVTAIKDGYVPSDAATKEIDASIIAGVRGDVNGDGVVNMPDAMFIVNKILNGKFPDEE